MGLSLASPQTSDTVLGVEFGVEIGGENKSYASPGEGFCLGNS